MKLAVCLKHVPPPDRVDFDRRTKRLRREGVAAVANPVDLCALGHALALRDARRDEVVAITMGPPSARVVLEDALRRGADRALHLVDRRFAGADTLATARALAQALGRERFDLVLCGRITLDGGTGQVAPQIAELAGLPQLTQATDLALDGSTLRAKRETDRGRESWTLALPAVVSVSTGPAPPPPGAPRSAGRVEELGVEELGGTPRNYGTRGSPTFVMDVREARVDRISERLTDGPAAVERLMQLVTGARSGSAEGPPIAPARDTARQLWALAERDGGELRRLSFESLACAATVAERLAAEKVAVLLCDEPGDLPGELAARGADRVLVVRHPSLAEYGTEPFTAALCAAIERLRPAAVIAPWSAQGRDFVPRLAARLGLGLTGDFVALEVKDSHDGELDLMWLKPALAGGFEAPVIAHTKPALGMLRPGVFPVPARVARAADVTQLDVAAPSTSTWGSCYAREDMASRQPVESARIVVGASAELGPGGLELARRLADGIQGVAAATPSAVAAGLAPTQLEVSELGRAIAPTLYIGLGCHEAQALRGLQRAGTVALVSVRAAGAGEADLVVAADPRSVVEGVITALARAEAGDSHAAIR